MVDQFIQNELGVKSGYYQSVSNCELSRRNIHESAQALASSVSSIEKLREVEFQGINIGISVASSLISARRCTQLDVEECRGDIASYLFFSMLFVVSFLRALAAVKVSDGDIFCFYNGRSYNTYPQSLIVEGFGKEIVYYERMGDGESLRTQTCRIHDFLSTSHLVKAFWEGSEDGFKEERAKAFFETQRTNVFAEGFSKSFSAGSEYVVYFVSSEDEYASLDPRITLSGIFATQREAVAWLIAWAGQQQRYRLVIRNHPNQASVCRRDFDYWHNLQGENVDIIPSDSIVSSYDLMRQSSKVLCFFSTAGIEAAYLGIPSIVLGNAVYKGLDAVYEPSSREMLRSMLDTDIAPKPAENALPHGYFSACYGLPMRLFKRLGFSRFHDYQNLFDG